jgi:arylsulfatase A
LSKQESAVTVATPLLSILLLAAAGPADAPPVNIVLLMTDDMGWRDLCCQGNDRLTTPALDRLARQGVRFTDAYSASPVCSPTRGAIITGQAPARLRITQHGKDGPAFWPKERPVQPPAAEHVLPLETITLADRLKAAGYATGFFGKWHLSGDGDPKDPTAGGPAFWPEHQGFDVNVGGCGLGGPPTYFDPYRIPAIRPRKQGEYLTDRLAAETVSFMTAHRQQPMFVCLWTYNPHYPFEAPEELVAKYRGKEGPGLKNPVYGAQIEATDRAIGTVLEAIDRLGLAARTLVLFTSDNGGWEGATDNRPLRSGKGDLYEGGIRVPLIIRWPEVVAPARPVAPGAVDHTPVVSMDLAATILDAAKAPLGPGESLDGTSLRPLLEGKRLDRAPLFFHYPHYAWHRSNRPGGAIRSGRYKLIRRYKNGERPEGCNLTGQRVKSSDQSPASWSMTENHRMRLMKPTCSFFLPVSSSSRRWWPARSPTSPSPPDRPNIVLILADDLGYGDLACYNPKSKVPTPRIDRLAVQGLRFTDAHSPSTVCTPTRYGILTGRMAFRTGFRGVFTGVGGPCMIEAGRLTLPGMLEDRGTPPRCSGNGTSA